MVVKVYELYNRSVISKVKEGDLLEINCGCNLYWVVYIGELEYMKKMFNILYDRNVDV